MISRRLALTIAVVLTTVLVQLCGFNELRLPYGPPDLPLLGVIALALRWGPEWGSCIGFATGLLLDVAPPAEHAVGRLALAYAVIGYVAGLLSDNDQTSVIATILTVVGGAVALVAIDTILTAGLGDGVVTTHAAIRLLVSTVGYDVVLAPLVIPLLSRLTRRLEPVGAW